MPRGKADFSTMKPFGTEGQLRFSPIVNASNQELTNIKDMNPAASLGPGVIDLGDISEVQINRGLELEQDLLVKELDDSLMVEKAMFQKAQVKQGLMGKKAMAQGPRPKPVSPKITVNQATPPKVQTAPAVNKPMKPVQVRGQSNPQVKEFDGSMVVIKAPPLGEVIEPIHQTATKVGKVLLRKKVKAEVKNELQDKGYRGNSSFTVTKGFETELVDKMSLAGLRNAFSKRKPTLGEVRSVFRKRTAMPKISTPTPIGHKPAPTTAFVPHTTVATPKGRRLNPDTPKPIREVPKTDAVKMELRETPKPRSGTQTQTQSTGQTVPAVAPEKHKWSTGTKVLAGTAGAGALYGGYKLMNPPEEYPDSYVERGYYDNLVSKSPKEDGVGKEIYSAGSGMGVIPAVALGVVGGDIANRIQDQRIKRGFSKLGGFLKRIKR